jgi:hypothetical protein
VLFDPETNHACGLNPVGVVIWRFIHRGRTLTEIAAEVMKQCCNVPAEAMSDVNEFVGELIQSGFAGYSDGVSEPMRQQ